MSDVADDSLATPTSSGMNQEADDSSNRPDLENLLITALDNVAKEDEENLKDEKRPIDDLVRSHLRRFYDSVKELTGVDVDNLLEVPNLTCDDGDIDQDPVDKDQAEESPLEEDITDYYDIDKDILLDRSASIEDLLKTPEFASCLDSIAENKDTTTQSLEDLIDNINAKIRSCSASKVEETSEDEKPAVKQSSSSEGNQVSDEGIFNSSEFENFFRSILDISRTEMKDVFEGDDDLPSTNEFEDFCLEIFKKVKSGSLDTGDETTGPKFVLNPVKDSLDEIEVTEAECQDLWKSLKLKSYYDCVQDNLDERGIVEPLHRILLIGKLASGTWQEAKQSYDNCILLIQEDILDESSKLTGCLVIFSSFFFHVAEGSAEAIENLIEETAKLVEEETLIQAKVIETVHEIPNRYFTYWKSVCIERKERPLVVKSGTSDESELMRKVKEFRERMRVLASYIQTVPYDEFEEKMQLLMPLDALPEESELNYLFQDNFFLTVQEHVNKYFRQTLFTSSEEFESPPVKRFDLYI